METNKIMDHIQTYLDYSDDELIEFTQNPRNLKMLEQAEKLSRLTFVFKVTESHGCICQHRKGQEITIRGDGSIQSNDSPEKICLYLLQSLTPLVFSAQEFVWAGMDPNQIQFNTVGCFDPGVRCGGIGHVNVSFQAVEKS